MALHRGAFRFEGLVAGQASHARTRRSAAFGRRRRATDVDTRPLRTQTWKCFTLSRIGRDTQLREDVAQVGRSRLGPALSARNPARPLQGR